MTTRLQAVIEDPTLSIAETVKRIHANDKPYEYGLDSLPQLRDELQSLKDRVGHATRAASAHAEQFDSLQKKLKVGKTAREKLISAVGGRPRPGASEIVQNLDREIERCEEDARDAKRERDRQQRIADATQKLIEDWPHHETLKRLMEESRAIGLVDGRLLPAI